MTVKVALPRVRSPTGYFTIIKTHFKEGALGLSTLLIRKVLGFGSFGFFTELELNLQPSKCSPTEPSLTLFLICFEKRLPRQALKLPQTSQWWR